MRALVRKNGGYACEERANPQPGKGQLLVRVAYCALNRADFAGESLLTKGKVVGSDVAGTVVSCGAGVRGFEPGDTVCGVTPGLAGGAAGLAVLDARWATPVPERMPLEEAAALPSAGVTAYAALRKVGAPTGTDGLPGLAGLRLLVCGASGGVGQYAVLLATALGAEVTAACSARNFEMARACGARSVADYGKGALASVADGSVDAVIGVNGRVPAREFSRMLRSGGTFVLLGTSLASPGVLALPLRGNRLKVALFFSQIGKGTLSQVARVMAGSGAASGPAGA